MSFGEDLLFHLVADLLEVSLLGLGGPSYTFNDIQKCNIPKKAPSYMTLTQVDFYD